MEHLVILDYATGEVDIYPSNIDDDDLCMEDLLNKLGHNANDCHWIFTSGNITFHGEVIK